MPANQSTPEVTRADECQIVDADIPSQTVRFRVPEGFMISGGIFRIERIRTATDEDKARWAQLPEPPADADDVTATLARGGDELQEALHSAIHRARHEWVCTHGVNGKGVDDAICDAVVAALASTDMVGAGEAERSAIKEYLIACADAADAQRLRCGSDTAMRANLTAEAKAYRNAARMIFEQDHASYRTAAPPVEGLTSGGGWQLVPVEPTETMLHAAYLCGDGGSPKTAYAAMLAASPKTTATASVLEPWPGYTADMERRRVVTLAKVGQMLSIMAGGEAAEVEGYDAGGLYAEVLMSLGVEDAEFPDLALQGVEDDPEAYFLTDSGTAATIGEGDDDDRLYLIRKGGLYYRPNAQGYTASTHDAGRYTLAEAIRHSHPNGLDGPRDGMDYIRADAATIGGERAC